MKSIKHLEEEFEFRQGITLYEQCWAPEDGLKAFVVIVHGLAEHSGRYQHVADYLCEHSFAAEAFDLSGHGRSSGKRSFIPSFNLLLDELDVILERAREKAEGKPVFLLGHSMGGAVVARYLIDRKPEINGAILSAALVKMGDSVSPLMIKVAKLLSAVLPNLPAMKIDQSTVSRDPLVVEKYDSDPLNYRGKLSVRTGAELNQAIQYIQENLAVITQPILILYGSEDKLVDPSGSQMVYERAGSEDKTIKEYPGLFHEILNEPEKEQVMDDIIAWMETRL